MIKGITVTLYVKSVPSGTDDVSFDEFNRPIFNETPVSVANVVVAPASSDAVINELSLSGKKLVYYLMIPKGDTHTWTDCRVSFFGADWRVFDYPEEWVDANVPGSWNRRVKVERYG